MDQSMIILAKIFSMNQIMTTLARMMDKQTIQPAPRMIAVIAENVPRGVILTLDIRLPSIASRLG